MKRTNLILVTVLTILLGFAAYLRAATVEFELLADPNNMQLLPQPMGQVGVSGDHLLQTNDDIQGSSYNPDGCLSFNFMNPVGIDEPDYPPGYVEGIHSITGSLMLEINLYAGGTVEIASLAFDGYVATGNPIAHQWLVDPNDPATDGSHGPVDGMPNSGTYTASADANWAFEMDFDWYYDTPFAGTGGIDMTFDNYHWSGFIIPVSELTTDGMNAATLDDPLGYFDGTSQDFECWLLEKVKPQLPQQATHLLFAQGEEHPVWTNPMMGMTTDGIVGETIIACAIITSDPNDADIDGDGVVDMFDYAIISEYWDQPPGVPSADIAPPSGDGTVNIDDLIFLAENWLWGITDPN